MDELDLQQFLIVLISIFIATDLFVYTNFIRNEFFLKCLVFSVAIGFFTYAILVQIYFKENVFKTIIDFLKSPANE